MPKRKERCTGWGADMDRNQGRGMYASETPHEEALSVKASVAFKAAIERSSASLG